jgi:hypothetical protein
MYDPAIYQKLGELTEAVKNLDKRFDKIDTLVTRVDSLEATRDKQAATIRTMKWIVGTVTSVITFIGAEKLVAWAATIAHLG